MDRKFLLSILLLLHASTAFGCVKFYAMYHPGRLLGDPYPLKITLSDNDSNNCDYDGTPNSGNKYQFSCSLSGTAVFDPTGNNNNGVVDYTPSWGQYNFNTDYQPADDNSFGSYNAWEYGC